MTFATPYCPTSYPVLLAFHFDNGHKGFALLMKKKAKGTGLKATKYGTVLYTRKYKKRKRPSIHEDQPVFYPDRKRESNTSTGG